MQDIWTEKISGWKGPVWKYEWSDDLGTHQYYVDDLDNQTILSSVPGQITNFKVDTKSIQGRIYSWKDNFGFHQHIVV